MIMSDAYSIIKGTNLIKIFKTGYFPQKQTFAVRGVDIEIQPGETYALVGESGSGKTTLGRMLLMLISPSMGEIIYNGVNITNKNHEELGFFRRKMQIIPQHPEDAFNPRWKVDYSILEPYRIHKGMLDSESMGKKLKELLQQTGLDPEYVKRYPHQLSGGELQRAAIARIIALDPDFIVCDEPTSMLDVSVQASIIHLLKDIQKKTRVAFLFITHDICLAKIVGDRVGVMYKGLIVEEGYGILSSPSHPYTCSLTRQSFSDKKPDNFPLNSGCQWYSVCHKADERCSIMPQLKSINGKKVRCHNPE